MKITEFLNDNILILDGGMGTLLQKKGLAPGELPERWNVQKPEVITQIHQAYYDAGSNVVCANTFGANSLKFPGDELEILVKAAVENAQEARRRSAAKQEKWVALDIGPSGRMLAPYGDFDFEEAVSLFGEVIRLGAKYGADLVFIETMNDSYETKAALLAAKENCGLPVFVSNAYSEDGKLMTGASPDAMVAMLEGMGADAIGMNCSLGPKALAGIAEQYLGKASIPVVLKPNAGLPKVIDGETVYDVGPEEFAAEVAALVEKGVRVVGGCCGTTPDYIAALTARLEGMTPRPLENKDITCVSSYTHAVEFGKRPILIGERINPTGKKKFQAALRAGDIDYILREGIAQQEKGVQVLDVNVGLPDIDEVSMLENAVCELQAIIDLPLQIDTSNIGAMEKALRRYNGKAMVNSVSGKQESMDAVFPLVKKYGGLVVALTLDEDGIPADADGRVKIAEKILKRAGEFGIAPKDIIFDPLTLTISADNKAAAETLKAVERIGAELGCHTSLGVSNVSFGLPQREIINSAFFTLAMGKGLSAAIMNPYSAEMMKSYYAFCALNGMDESCGAYIGFVQELPQNVNTAPAAEKPVSSGKEDEGRSALQTAIVKGLKEQAARMTAELLKTVPPLQIVQEEIIPALDIVGVGFEKKTVYLPQLLMSAEAAKFAFEQVKGTMPKNSEGKCAVLIATVHGDIHDIGKNIVKLLLENYGFDVIDLGRDVPPERIVECTVMQKVPVVGLSALMTTTVPAMEETIRQLRGKAPWCKVIVGGAVLDQKYADAIGADRYAKDAMEAVRYAEEINRSLNA